MPQDLTDDKSTLVQVMAWCRLATSHYLNQCWPRFPMPYGVTRPQWVKTHVLWNSRFGSELFICCCHHLLSWGHNFSSMQIFLPDIEIIHYWASMIKLLLNNFDTSLAITLDILYTDGLDIMPSNIHTLAAGRMEEPLSSLFDIKKN